MGKIPTWYCITIVKVFEQFYLAVHVGRHHDNCFHCNGIGGSELTSQPGNCSICIRSLNRLATTSTHRGSVRPLLKYTRQRESPLRTISGQFPPVQGNLKLRSIGNQTTKTRKTITYILQKFEKKVVKFVDRGRVNERCEGISFRR